MNSIEKISCICSLVFIAVAGGLLIAIPATRTMPTLLLIALAGVTVNAFLLFIVFRDILARDFGSSFHTYRWIAAIFLCFPLIILYLPLHGFKPRS